MLKMIEDEERALSIRISFVVDKNREAGSLHVLLLLLR